MVYINNLGIDVNSNNSTINYSYNYFSTLGSGNDFASVAASLSPETIMASLRVAVAARMTIALGVSIDPFEIVFDQPGIGLSAAILSSYQTIISQSGTAAPAIAGGLSPVSSYASGVTFAWARTGAGVYTLTASSAVFVAGKTGVFIAPLQNLNASVRGVVTSSTVITVTTAVQSVAILGLLGLAATNTDALLNGTMIYVQTYI